MDSPPPDDYRPAPGDWDLPPEAKETLGPLAYAILSEAELDGIPVGVCFQASKEYASILSRIEAGADSALIMAQIQEIRAPWEERYPAAGIWDRLHGLVATHLAHQGYVQEALGLIPTIVSPYEKIALIDGLEDVDGIDFSEVVGRLMAGADDNTKRAGLARALRDHLIDRALDPEHVDTLDQFLATTEVEADPVTGWVQSRKIAKPRLDWAYAEHMAQQAIWPPKMSAYWKRYVLLAMTEVISQIDSGDIAPDTLDAIAILDHFEANFGTAEIWDQLRAGLALKGFAKAQAESAMLVSRSIKDPETLASLSVAVAQLGEQQAALDLVSSNPSPALAVHLLLDIEWTDPDAGVRRLSGIIEDVTEPKERRIAMMEAVRDRFIDISALDKAVEWQNMIDSLQATD